MGFLDLPTELILLVLPSLSESDLAHLLRVHGSMYNIVLPHLYRCHLQTTNTNNNFSNFSNLSRNEANGFFWSIVAGNTAAVQHFLTYGADVNAIVSAASIRQAITSASSRFVPWHDMQMPLNIAANMGNDELVSLLLSHGASVNGLPSSSSTGGQQGVVNPRRTVVQPAVVDALLSGHESTLRLLLRHNSPLHDPDMERGGLVNCAIAREHGALLDVLVREFGADLNVAWQEGVYPLNRAVASNGPRAAEIVRRMLDNGADITKANGGSSDDVDAAGQRRLLNQAIRQGTIDTLRLLLERGVVTSSPLNDNAIFRTWVIERCSAEAVGLLHKHGCFASDFIQDTLMIAVRARRGDILQLFIDSGGVVDLNAKLTRGGSTLLHTAVVRCKPPMGEARAGLSITSMTILPLHRDSDLLVRKIEPDIDPHSTSRRCMSEKVQKCTPADVVRCLVRGGADANVLDARGLSPLDLAEKYSPAVQQILVES